MEKNIDCMKYRKSTHLAGVDVEAIIAEKGKCILTIQEAIYDTGIDVSGKKLDGYFIKFKEAVKDMMANSTNRKTISNIAKVSKNLSNIDSRNIGNWAGLQIELTFDETVKMKGEVVGGIRIKPVSPAPQISDKNAIELLNTSTTIEELKTNWDKISKDEAKIPTVIALKETLKNKFTANDKQ